MMVKRQSGFFATATASALLVASLALAASAQADTLPTSPERGLLLLAEAEQSAERPIIHLSDEGLKAVRAISAARLAIFEGRPEEAEKLLKRAKADLGGAAKTADKLAVKPRKAQNGVLIPIDARLTLADDFILTPEKAAKIAKVNEHLKKGESKQAIEILRDAGIYLNLTAVLLYHFFIGLNIIIFRNPGVLSLKQKE